ncbi:uncharacterized protein LOC113505064 [Trichoplusia ni]|uniref:Uncharacterized protein LOC113505064 n=1 Tax=Trichoplusia ni TaxID=7111 RepID=A0A7E5WSV1_TRINI|nr:uncharacterized protein LOC113505064 [Trichoplusia ni]
MLEEFFFPFQNGLHSSVFNRESLGIISQLLRKDSRDPLIVFVDTSKNIRTFEDDNFYGDSNSAGEVDESGEYNVNPEKVKEKYDAVLYNVLRTSNVITDASGDTTSYHYHKYDRKETKRKAIEKLIRDRCQAKVVCTEKCSAENTLRKRYCQKSCKAVFDHLVKCPPPGNEKKKKKPPPPPPKDSCGSDSCASKNSCDDDSCKPKDSCEDDSCKSKDSCDEDSCKPKNSCDEDSCKPKDSCEASDSCNQTTPKKKGKTCPPSWRK